MFTQHFFGKIGLTLIHKLDNESNVTTKNIQNSTATNSLSLSLIHKYVEKQIRNIDQKLVACMK